MWGLRGRIRSSPRTRGKKSQIKKIRWDQKEACEARLEAPFELGAKMPDVLEESKNGEASQANKDWQECQIPEGKKEESIAEEKLTSDLQH